MSSTISQLCDEIVTIQHSLLTHSMTVYENKDERLKELSTALGVKINQIMRMLIAIRRTIEKDQ